MASEEKGGTFPLKTMNSFLLTEIVAKAKFKMHRSLFSFIEFKFQPTHCSTNA